MNIRELITLIGFELDDTDAKKADQIFSKLVFGAKAVAVAGAAVVAGLIAIAKVTSDVGDEAAKTGVRLGITAEEVQQLGYAGENSGVGFEALAGGLRTMQKTAVLAARGNKEAAASFGRLGVKVKDAGEIKPTIELMKEIADKIAAIKDPAKRSEAAGKAFGRTFGPEMLPLLLEGSRGIDAMMERAKDLGFVMSNEAAKAAEKLNDSFTDLALASKGVGLRFGTAIGPASKKLADTFTNLLIRNRKLIDKGINVLAKVLEHAASAIIKLVNVIDEHMFLFTAFAAIMTTIGTVALVSFLAAMWPLIAAFSPLIAGFVGLASAAVSAAAAMVLPLLPWLILGGLLALIIEDIYMFATGGESAIGDLGNAFKLLFIWLREWASDFFNWLLTAHIQGFKLLGDALVAVFTGNSGALKDLFGASIAEIGTMFSNLGAWLLGFWSSVYGTIAGFAWNSLKAIAGFFGPIFETVFDFLKGRFLGLVDNWKSAVLGFVQFLAEKLPAPIRGMLESGASAVSGLFSQQPGGVSLPALASPGGPAAFMSNAFGSSTPVSSTFPMTAGRSNSSSVSNNNVSVGGARVEVHVNGNASVEEIAAATSSSVDEANEQFSREIESQFRVNR